jgi:hypothetical protein
VVVNGIRHALGDDARQPRFIRTVHGFGYAFCGEARQTLGPESAPAEPKQEASVEGSPAGRGTAKAAERWRWAVAAAAALAVLFAGAYWVQTHAVKETAAKGANELTAVPLTSLPGAELDPALCPDGRRVAFVWDGPDRINFDVWVKDIASGEMTRVTSAPASDYHLSGVRTGDASRS